MGPIPIKGARRAKSSLVPHPRVLSPPKEKAQSSATPPLRHPTHPKAHTRPSPQDAQSESYGLTYVYLLLSNRGVKDSPYRW